MIKVMETNVLHASAVIYWLDGSSATDPDRMKRLEHPMAWSLASYPKDLTVVHGPGKSGLIRKPVNTIIEGYADEDERSFVAGTPYALNGEAFDSKGFYNPRAFSLTVGDGSGHSVVLYPTPIGSRVTAVGGLYASMRWASDGTAVCWALATLTVSIPGVPQPQVYQAQADHRGELVIAWNRVPPLSAGQTHYPATLAVTALATASGEKPIDPSTLLAAEIESTSSAGVFSDPIGLEVVPGERLIMRSASQDHLIVQPS